MLVLALVLAFVWGVCWSVFLQFHPLGRFLVIKRTWVTVVIGVGVDLVIMLLVVETGTWLKIASIIVLSSIGIIARSLVNELREVRGELNAIKKTGRGEKSVSK